MAFMAKAARSDEANAHGGKAGTAPEGSASSESAAGVLEMAQKLHEQYVAEGQDTRERLITEGQSVHDQVIGEAAARKEELLSTGQAKYDEFVSDGAARHDVLIAEADALVADATAEHDRLLTEARERSTGMVVEAQKVRAEVLEGLGKDRSVLEQEIEDLRIFERDRRAPLKSYIEDQLVELEHSGIDETAS
jgi:cell division septum initiation protein DivIVA